MFKYALTPRLYIKLKKHIRRILFIFRLIAEGNTFEIFL